MIRPTTISESLAEANFSESGSVAYLVEKPAPGIHEARESVAVVAGVGFAGDHPRKSFWKGEEIPGREVSAIAVEVLRAMRAAPDVTGDNLITRGIDLRALEVGDRLHVGHVVLERGPKPHRPCQLFRSRLGDEAFEAAAAGLRGALFVVIRGGVIRIDDPIRVGRKHVMPATP